MHTTTELIVAMDSTLPRQFGISPREPWPQAAASFLSIQTYRHGLVSPTIRWTFSLKSYGVDNQHGNAVT